MANFQPIMSNLSLTKTCAICKPSYKINTLKRDFFLQNDYNGAFAPAKLNGYQKNKNVKSTPKQKSLYNG